MDQDWLVSSLAEVFEAVRLNAQECSGQDLQEQPEDLRRLDHRARVVLGLFAEREPITASQVADELGLSQRMARNLLGTWVKEGWLELPITHAGPEPIVYRQNIGNTLAAYRQ